MLPIAAYAVVKKLGNDDPAPVTKGPKTLKTEDVTIPEGYTRSQIADVAKDAGLKGDYEKVTATGAQGLRHREDRGAGRREPRGLPLPGHLQPREGASVDTLVKDQLSAFNDNFAQVDMSKAARRRT